MTSRPIAALKCTVSVRYLSEQSDPSAGRYAFAYTVSIRNVGEVAAQVVGRHWIITDAHGHAQEVRGLGVVGHQPLLRPGETFEYSSWTPLTTPTGQMSGEYLCMSEDAHWFEASVEAFTLALPQALH